MELVSRRDQRGRRETIFLFGLSSVVDYADEDRPSVTDITRRNIADALRLRGIAWWGDIDEIDFLKRVFDLSALPSTDSRHRDAEGDIARHRHANNDWEDDWVFSDRRLQLDRGPDEIYLRFLCEMLHPVVRRNAADVETLRDIFNEHLKRDGWEVYASTEISGYPVFSARRVDPHAKRTVGALKSVASALGMADHIAQQITRIEASIERDPALAIGTAKELVETVCKSILVAREVAPQEWDVPRLVRETAQVLALVPDNVDNAAKGSELVKRVLGNLSQIAGGMAELRNLYGTGHGRAAGARGLTPRHARLAVGAVTTLVVFLQETHEVRPK